MGIVYRVTKTAPGSPLGEPWGGLKLATPGSRPSQPIRFRGLFLTAIPQSVSLTIKKPLREEGINNEKIL